MIRHELHSLFWTMIQRVGVWLQEVADRHLNPIEDLLVEIKREWL